MQTAHLEHKKPCAAPWRNPMPSEIPSSQGRGRPSTGDTHSEIKPVYFKPAQMQALETWLRRTRPGVKTGTFIREAALQVMESAAGATDSNTIRLHLAEEDRESVMDVARELGHRDLSIFAEELLLRAAQRDPDEVIRFFRGKPEPALTLVPPTAMPAPEELPITRVEMGKLFDEMIKRQAQRQDGEETGEGTQAGT